MKTSGEQWQRRRDNGTDLIIAQKRLLSGPIVDAAYGGERFW